MTTTVGPTGEIVIDQEIRDRLQIEPGWLAIQRLVDGHVEVYFLPPEHNDSLRGSLAPYTDVRIAPGEEWERAMERAWDESVREGWSQGEQKP